MFSLLVLYVLLQKRRKYRMKRNGYQTFFTCLYWAGSELQRQIYFVNMSLLFIMNDKRDLKTLITVLKSI